MSGLRRERDRGRLTIERNAGKDFVTLRAIADMRKLNEVRKPCPDQQKARASNSSEKNDQQTGNSSGTPHGSSETERVRSAQAALQRTADES